MAMMELPQAISESLRRQDFCHGKITKRHGEKGKYDIELETRSPEGEDVIISLVYDGTGEDFIKEFTAYADGFDAEEHAEAWIGSRGKNGVPERIKDLMEDAEWIKDKLLETAEILGSDEEEKPDDSTGHNRGQVLKALRACHDISCTDMAGKTGFTKAYISALEKGRRAPTENVIRKYSMALDIPEDMLKHILERYAGKELPFQDLLLDILLWAIWIKRNHPEKI